MYLLSHDSHQEIYDNIQDVIEKLIQENKNNDLYFIFPEETISEESPEDNPLYKIKIFSKFNDNLNYSIHCKKINGIYKLLSGLITASGLEFSFDTERIYDNIDNLFDNEDVKRDLIEKLKNSFYL